MDLIFSDIHADIDSLKTILFIVNSKEFKKKYGEFSRIINLGDVLERGTNPKQVLEDLQNSQKTTRLSPLWEIMMKLFYIIER